MKRRIDPLIHTDTYQVTCQGIVVGGLILLGQNKGDNTNIFLKVTGPKAGRCLTVSKDLDVYKEARGCSPNRKDQSTGNI